MWRLSLAVFAAAVLGLAAYSFAPTPAYACSAGPDFDPVASSEVIVEGRFLGYEVLPDAPLSGSDGDGLNDAYVPVRVDMAVVRVLKGTVEAPTIEIVDPRTLSPPYPGHDEYEWIGASGSCGAFDSDPTGLYAIMGLSEASDGTYSANRLLYFYYGEEASGERYDAALQRMATWPGAAALPALGSGPDVGAGGAAPLATAAVLAAIGAGLLGLGILSRVRLRKTA